MTEFKKDGKQVLGATFNRLINFLAISLLLFLITGCSMNNANSNSPKSPDNKKNIFTRFEADVKSDQVTDLKSIIKSPYPSMKITRKNIQNLIHYAHQHPGYIKKQIHIMKKQKKVVQAIDARLKNKASQDHKNTKTKSINKPNTNVLNKGDFIYTHFKGKPFHIMARPFQLKLDFNEFGVTFWINGKVHHLKPNHKWTLIKMLPANIYTIKVQKKYDYTTLTAKKKVTLLNNPSDTRTVWVDLKGTRTQIISSQKNVNILMNGKKIGVAYDPPPKSIKPGPFYGPFPVNGSIVLQGEKTYPWGTIKTKKHVVTDQTVVLVLEPRLYRSKKEKQQIVKTINQFAKERWQALVTQDSSVLKAATGSAKQSVENDILKSKSQGERYHGRVVGTKINFNMSELKQLSHNQYSYKVLVQFDRKEAISNGNSSMAHLKDHKEGDFVTLTYLPKSKAWTVTKVFPQIFQSGKDELIIRTAF